MSAAASFMLNGKRYELATIDTLSFDEAKVVKRISGLPPVKAGEAFGDLDPDATLAFLVVSLMRTDPTINADAQLADLGSLNIVEIVESIEHEEAGDERPPAQTPAARSSSPGASAEPASSPPSTMIPEPSGTPAGSPQTSAV